MNIFPDLDGLTYTWYKEEILPVILVKLSTTMTRITDIGFQEHKTKPKWKNR